jgi:hypothetical protein
MLIGIEYPRVLFEESSDFIKTGTPEFRGIPEPCEKHEIGSPLQVPGNLSIHPPDQIPVSLNARTKKKGV